MYLCQCREGEAAEVDLSGASQFLAVRLGDGAGELCTPDSADTLCLQGYGTRNGRVAAELRAVPGGRVGGDDQGVVLLIP